MEDTLYQNKKLFLLLILLSIFVAFIFQGSRGLYESTEGRYAECTRQTLKTGDLDDLILNGEGHWTKPPLTYYCIAGGIKLLGRNAWGARAYLCIAFLLTITAVYYLANELWGGKTAFFSALIYATSPFTIAAESVVAPDTLLVLWQSLSLLFFWLAVTRKNKAFILAMWLCAALAHLTKGPAGLLPLAGIIPVYFIIKRRCAGTPNIFNFFGLIIFIVVGFSWYIIEALEPQNAGLMHYWIYDEIIGRNIEGEFKKNPEFYKAFLIYPPLLIFGTGLWAGALLLKWKGILHTRKDWFRWHEGGEKIKWLYLVFTFFPPLIIFFLSKSKMPLYILPLFAPLSVAMGRVLNSLLDRNKIAIRTVLTIAFCSAFLIGGVKFTFARIESKKDMNSLSAKVGVLIKLHPNHAVYNVGCKTLGGLQFYLDELVLPVTAEELPVVLKEDYSKGITPIVVVGKNILDKTTPNIDLKEYRVKELNRFWAVIIPVSAAP